MKKTNARGNNIHLKLACFPMIKISRCQSCFHFKDLTKQKKNLNKKNQTESPNLPETLNDILHFKNSCIVSRYPVNWEA